MIEYIFAGLIIALAVFGAILTAHVLFLCFTSAKC